LDQAEADRAIDGILKDAGRNAAAKCLAYLHVTGGLTLPRLQALCASIGFISPGRVRALLLYHAQALCAHITFPDGLERSHARHIATDRHRRARRQPRARCFGRARRL
jgi:hypothetical protein